MSFCLHHVQLMLKSELCVNLFFSVFIQIFFKRHHSTKSIFCTYRTKNGLLCCSFPHRGSVTFAEDKCYSCCCCLQVHQKIHHLFKDKSKGTAIWQLGSRKSCCNVNAVLMLWIGQSSNLILLWIVMTGFAFHGGQMTLCRYFPSLLQFHFVAYCSGISRIYLCSHSSASFATLSTLRTKQ